MSMDLMVKAMKTKVGNPLRKLVLVKLADNASDQGECWPSYQHIADQCEISRSTVKVHIRELEKAGFLRREFRRKGELNQSNVFHLSFEGGAGDTLGGGAGENPPGAAENPGGGAAAAPRTSHSLEPVNEPKSMADKAEMLFAKFWKCYPKKQKRVDALKAWKKLKLDDALFDLIMQALARHCQSLEWLKANGQYVPHPATWLHGKRWEDELPPSPNLKAPSRHTGLDAIDHTAGLEVDDQGNYRIGGFQ